MKQASQMFTPCCQTSAKTTTQTASVEATEMSISPATTTSVSPSAIRPIIVYGFIRSRRFSVSRKKGESDALQAPAARMRRTSTNSQRPTSERAKAPARAALTSTPPRVSLPEPRSAVAVAALPAGAA